jgi:hypothetical protein
MSWTIIAQTSDVRPQSHKYNITAHGSGTAGAIKSEIEIDREAILNDFQKLLPFISGIRFRSSQKFEELVSDPCQLVNSIRTRLYLALTDEIRNVINNAESVHIFTDDLEIPWEMLGKGTEDLGYSIGISPLSKRRFLTNKFENPQRINILFVVDTKNNLPQTRSEIQNIIRELENNPYTSSKINYVILQGKDATYSNVRKHLLQQYFDIVHVATHTEPSGVVLNDGLLLPDDINNDTSRGAPWLVFLNSCESGIVKDLDTYDKYGELSNLSIAFLSAGASSYIGTSCIINDTSASQLASSFYRQLFLGISVGVSLLNAKKEFIKYHQEDGDLSWMAFRLYGDPNSKKEFVKEFKKDFEDEVKRYIKGKQDKTTRFDIIQCAKDLGINISEIRAIISRMKSQPR